jgi:hypothetical protein
LLVLFYERHCFTVHSLQLSDKNLPIYQEGKNPYRYNHLEHQKERLLPIKGYTPNLASHKRREKNNKRKVRVGTHTTPSKYRNLSLAISSRAFTPKNKNTHKTFNAHKKNKNKKTRDDGVKRKKYSAPRSVSSIKQKQRIWQDGWKEVST